MTGRYDVGKENRASDLDVPKRWWWPILFGVFMTPAAIVLAVLSHGFGHDDGFADDLLFPLHHPLRILLGSGNAAGFIMYFGQFAAYGVTVALAARRQRAIIAAIVLVAFHAASFLLRYQIADLLISVND